MNKDVHLQVKLCLKCEVLQKECNINPLTFIFYLYVDKSEGIKFCWNCMDFVNGWSL